MARITSFVSTAATALVFAIVAAIASASNASAVNAATGATPATPSKAALAALERKAYDAWKSRDAGFWDEFLSAKFVGWGPSGRLDKAAATKQYTGVDCEIKSYSLSDERVSPLGKDAALLTHKITVDGTCRGQKVPADSWAASIYVRQGGRWQAVFHAQAAVVDPKAAPVTSIDKLDLQERRPTGGDARTEAMLVSERVLWEAWRKHDATKMAALTATDISFINIFGVYLPTKAEALENWSGTGCDVRSVDIYDAAGTMLSERVSILTFKATADGTCYGQKVGPVWGTSIRVKEGGIWKWKFGINLPAGREGS